jgi:IS4 transposase
MSHRDKDCRTSSGTYAQDLSVAINGLVSEVDWNGIRFRKDCTWAVRGLVTAALIWAWSSKIALKDRFAQATRCARGLGRNFAPVETSYQAFIKLLVRWTAELRGCLVPAFQRLMESGFPDLFRMAGYVVVAGDGSKLQLARTRSNEARYSPATRGKKGKKRRKADRRKRRPRSCKGRAQQARDKKADSPQMALTLFYHVMLRLPWDWQLGPSDSSEREHLRAMIPHLPPDALVTADCGFVGYEFWSDLLASRRQFVIRAGGNVRLLKKLGVVRESKGTVYLWPDKVAKRKQKPLVLRLVTVHDGRQPWYLVTSVLDPKRLSDRRVAEIYKRRWRIELFFRHFKRTFGRAKLRSHKAEHAECETVWSLLGLWAMLLHAQFQLPRKNGKTDCLSVARVLCSFGQAIDEYKCRPEAGESLSQLLAAAVVDHYHRRDKTSRNYPRKKYESQVKAPLILEATRSQCQHAEKVMSRAA